jgi:hypothetical protein
VSTEENKAIVRAYIEAAVNRGDMSAIDRWLSPDYRNPFTPGASAAGYKRGVGLAGERHPLWLEVDDEASSLLWGGVEWGARFTMRLLALCPRPDLLPRDQLASVMASAMRAAGPLPAG